MGLVCCPNGGFVFAQEWMCIDPVANPPSSLCKTGDGGIATKQLGFEYPNFYYHALQWTILLGDIRQVKLKSNLVIRNTCYMISTHTGKMSNIYILVHMMSRLYTKPFYMLGLET